MFHRTPPIKSKLMTRLELSSTDRRSRCWRCPGINQCPGDATMTLYTSKLNIHANKTRSETDHKEHCWSTASQTSRVVRIPNYYLEFVSVPVGLFLTLLKSTIEYSVIVKNASPHHIVFWMGKRPCKRRRNLNTSNADTESFLYITVEDPVTVVLRIPNRT